MVPVFGGLLLLSGIERLAAMYRISTRRRPRPHPQGDRRGDHCPRRPRREPSVLKDAIPDYTWVGIYLLEGDELVLGPFLGKPSPHTRIPLGQGICGAAATEKATHHRRRRECRSAVSRLQHRNAVRDRRPDHARRTSARRDRHRQRSPRGVRCSRSRAAEGSRRAHRSRARGESIGQVLSRHVPHHYAHPRRRHRARSVRGGRADLQGRRPSTSSGTATKRA